MPVYIIGAGPGDPELLTLKAHRLLASADAVLYDALANPALLEIAPPGAERCYVGKRSRTPAVAQPVLTEWMISRARRGLNVVRLQGGDPLIYGRCGEEIAALTAAGVPFEIVPGITSASGAAAALGLPLTHRQLAAGVRFFSGAGLLVSPPAPALAGPQDTLAIYMGLEQLEVITAALLGAGWPSTVEAALVERATLPGQRHIIAPLRLLPARAREAGIAPPALLLVGDLIAWRRRLDAAPACGPVLAAAPAPDGIILITHGSPRLEWQHGVHQLARELAQPGQFSRAAFLPPGRPGLDDVVRTAAANGVHRLAVVPYFLAPGLPVRRDLPALVAAARRHFPKLQLELAACLDGHPALRTAVLARAAEAWAASTASAPAPQPLSQAG